MKMSLKMDYWRREQVGAATGIVAVVCMTVAGFLPGTYPKPDATGAQIATFLNEHRTQIVWQTFLMGAAVVFGLWFLGSLRAMLRRAEGGAGRLSAVAYAGGLLTLAGSLGTQMFTTVPAYRPIGEFTDATIRTLYSFGAMANTFAAFPLLLFVGATTLVLMRTDVLPKFVTWLGALAIAGAALGTLTLFYESGDLAVGSVVAFFAPFLSASVMVLAASITMIPRLGAPQGITHMQRRVGDIWTDEERTARRAAEQQ